MDTSSVTCKICGENNHVDIGNNAARIPSNIRQFKDEIFTVWRCSRCSSLSSLEDINFGHYYENYVMHKQKLDFATRLLFSSRLRQLKRGGLLSHHFILDYGCGNGNFIKYIQEKGYCNAMGYDPFSSQFSDSSVCQQKFDVVCNQDVIEHDPDPIGFLDKLSALIRRPGGKLAIGTPNAEYVDLNKPTDRAWWLHQPHHRHIIGGKKLIELLEQKGFRIDLVEHRSYVDTTIPFLNSAFYPSYITYIDSTVDSIFDPIKLDLVYKTPKLLFYGLFGYFLNQKKDIFIVATAL